MKKSYIVFFVLMFMFASFISIVPSKALAQTESRNTVLEVKPVTFWDKVGLFFTFSVEKKAVKQQDFSDRYFQAAQKEIEGSGDAEKAKPFFEKAEINLTKAVETAGRISDEKKQEEVLSGIIKDVTVRREVLTEVREKVENPVAKEAINQSLTRQQEVKENADEKIRVLLARISELEQKVMDLESQLRRQDDSSDTVVPLVTTGNTGSSARVGDVGSDDIVPLGGPDSLCVRSSTPSITVLSPNGGETYTTGQTIKLKWKSCNIDSNATLAVELLYGTDGIMVDFVPNTGSHTFQLSLTALMNPPVPPSQPVTYGTHFKIHVGTPPTTFPSYHDWSDDFFTINSPTVVLTQSQAETLVHQTWSDCSQGDCGGVTVTVTQNSNGQYVVTAIFTELDDSTSQTKRVSVATYQNGTWTLGQPTITRMCHRGNADGTTGWTAGLCL